MQKYAFFDVDRTIRKGSAALDFCQYLAKNGFIDNAFIAKDSYVRKNYTEGNIDYQNMVQNVVTIHGEVLAGLSVEQLAKNYVKYIEETSAFFDWTEKLFKLLKRNNVKIILVSAGILPAIEAIGKHLGADHIFTSQPEIIEGYYTGRVSRILHDKDKNELVRNFISNLNNEHSTIGFGDSTGDVSMLEQMDNVVIYDPHQKVMFQIAKEKDWAIVKNGDEMLKTVENLLD